LFRIKDFLYQMKPPEPGCFPPIGIGFPGNVRFTSAERFPCSTATEPSRKRNRAALPVRLNAGIFFRILIANHGEHTKAGGRPTVQPLDLWQFP
jgi:hypothetical protein